MTGRRKPGMGRAIVAVAALYGWLLQAFVAALHPGPLPPAPGGICAPGLDHASAAGDPAAPSGREAHGCCLAACAAPPPPARVATSEAIAWPRSGAATTVWGAAAPILPTGPPASAFRARAPPAA